MLYQTLISQVLLHKALLEFNEKEKALSVIQRKLANFDIITSQADLRKLTNEFTGCSVLKYLNETKNSLLLLWREFFVRIYQHLKLTQPIRFTKI
ncbi:hypothetical protein [Peribacillus loiseleuriae]|uniref:hypothetical protein n=1 Tax=Peribacillus loiseleuriae TaxID=1679170 RepID=UPI003D06548C